MHIYLNAFSNYAVAFFEQSIQPSLVAQHKKILVVALAALGLLALGYVMSRYYFFDGQHKIICSDGKIKEGEFKNGKLNGKGKIIFEAKDKDPKICGGDGSYTMEGEFKDDKLNGQGKKVLNYFDIYEGEFKDGQLNGKGKITLERGVIYEGEFKNDKLNGKGRKNQFDFIYEGEFINDQLKQGKLTTRDGDVYEGEFNGKDNEKLNGQGKITYSDGTVEEGIFKDNVLVV